MGSSSDRVSARHLDAETSWAEVTSGAAATTADEFQPKEAGAATISTPSGAASAAVTTAGAAIGTTGSGAVAGWISPPMEKSTAAGATMAASAADDRSRP